MLEIPARRQGVCASVTRASTTRGWELSVTILVQFGLTVRRPQALSRSKVDELAQRTQHIKLRKDCEHPPYNPGANLESFSDMCYLREVASELDLTQETIDLPLGSLQGEPNMHVVTSIKAPRERTSAGWGSAIVSLIWLYHCTTLTPPIAKHKFQSKLYPCESLCIVKSFRFHRSFLSSPPWTPEGFGPTS